jgi:hypothetical protein
MDSHDKLLLRNPGEMPTGEILVQALGGSCAAYEALQSSLPSIEMEQVWQWYTPYKAWFAKGQHFWTTSRGTKKEKNLYWLYVYDGYFSVVIWFKEKNRQAAMNANVSEHTKQLIQDAETMGKLPAFPVVLNIREINELSDIYTLIDRKKRLEK